MHPGFDIDALPFVRDSLNGGDLVDLVPAGASVLVVPRPHERLVRTVAQRNAASGRDEVVRFKVPPKRTPPGSDRSNCFATTLELTAVDDVRLAPEYVNIRHRVRREKGGALVVEDMRELPADRFVDAIDRGDYEAAHFTDDTCDGAIVAKVSGVAQARPSLPAYSLVSAPDFFPLADQLEIMDWVRRTLEDSGAHFAQGGPWPLCEGRWPANLRLPRPGALADMAFAPGDKTVAAVVSPRPRVPAQSLVPRLKRFASFLPDAASNVFAPGWDASLSTDGTNRFLANFGLGAVSSQCWSVLDARARAVPGHTRQVQQDCEARRHARAVELTPRSRDLTRLIGRRRTTTAVLVTGSAPEQGRKVTPFKVARHRRIIDGWIPSSGRPRDRGR